MKDFLIQKHELHIQTESVRDTHILKTSELNNTVLFFL